MQQRFLHPRTPQPVGSDLGNWERTQLCLELLEGRRALPAAGGQQAPGAELGSRLRLKVNFGPSFSYQKVQKQALLSTHLPSRRDGPSHRPPPGPAWRPLLRVRNATTAPHRPRLSACRPAAACAALAPAAAAGGGVLRARARAGAEAAPCRSRAPRPWPRSRPPQRPACHRWRQAPAAARPAGVALARCGSVAGRELLPHPLAALPTSGPVAQLLSAAASRQPPLPARLHWSTNK